MYVGAINYVYGTSNLISLQLKEILMQFQKGKLDTPASTKLNVWFLVKDDIALIV